MASTYTNRYLWAVLLHKYMNLEKSQTSFLSSHRGCCRNQWPRDNPFNPFQIHLIYKIYMEIMTCTFVGMGGWGWKRKRIWKENSVCLKVILLEKLYCYNTVFDISRISINVVMKVNISGNFQSCLNVQFKRGKTLLKLFK